jgi:MFS family permease
MTEGTDELVPRRDDYFDLGSLFRNSATITFVIQIAAVILIVGSLTAYAIGDLFFAIADELKILLLLVISIIFLIFFLAAISAFVRFSRKIGNAVVGPGIEQVRFDTPKVRMVVILYGTLVVLMAVTGLYIWYLIDLYYLAPWVAAANSVSLGIFSIALGAFMISLLVQIIIAGVGRSATKIIIEVLDADDDDEFMR